MRVLTALRWTRSLNASLAKTATIVQKYCVNAAVVDRAFHSQNNKSRSSPLTGITDNPRRDSENQRKQSIRSFSVTVALAKSKDRDKKKKSGKAQQVNVNELAEFVKVDHITLQFEKAVEDLRTNFIKHLTLRSSVGAIEQLPVTFEGQDYSLQELVDVARKPKTVVLNVNIFPQAIPQILQALNKSGMNLNPQQDGTTIFIPIPKVTREHRESLSKNAKALYVKSRDNIKDIRNKEIRNVKKIASISEDSVRRVQTQLEALCDRYINEAEQVLEAKQKDLLGSSD